MNKIDIIEQQLDIKFPNDYKLFLSNADKFIIENFFSYCVILQNNYRTDGCIYEFYTVDNFIEKQKYRGYLVEDQAHFENPKDYVEAEYLYHIAGGTGSICISLGGLHYGKIFSVDNGDFGIIYQADNINLFIDSLYEPSKLRCSDEELIECVKTNNLRLLSELVETRDGNKRIEHSSWLDIELFEIAYKSGFDNILKYLVSKGYKGHNRMDYYNLKF